MFEDMFNYFRCKWQEEKMARNKRRPPSRKSNHISTVLNSDKNNLRASIQKKKQRLEKIPQQEVSVSKILYCLAYIVKCVTNQDVQLY